MAATYF